MNNTRGDKMSTKFDKKLIKSFLFKDSSNSHKWSFHISKIVCRFRFNQR